MPETISGRISTPPMTLVALVLLTCVAHAETKIKPFVIDDDDGGMIGTYSDFYRRLEATGVPVVIDGECNSACTHVLHLPTSQVCATPRATLGFHNSTYDGDGNKVDRAATVAFARHFYPPKVAAWFLKQNFGKHNEGITRKATDMGVRPCSKEESHGM